MDPKGSNLASTDLLEISQLVSGSYVTKSITGAEIIASIPPSTTAWGTITGTLSSQTDLNTALSGKVPTTRTLTINGTTQDLSADRTFTVSTGITIGTTAITSGTVGRVLFEGTGNVVQESANLFWDNTNGRLGIGTSTPANVFSILSNLNTSAGVRVQNTNAGSSAVAGLDLVSNSAQGSLFATSSTYATYGVLSASSVGFYTTSSFNIALDSNTSNFSVGIGISPSAKFRIVGSTGNVLINTTTDAGFKLDVNGTARVSGQATIAGTTNASAGIGRNTLINGTITATANSNVLVGLDIEPTFNTGAFTGVETLALRVTGFISNFTSSGATQLRIIGPSGSNKSLFFFNSSTTFASTRIYNQGTNNNFVIATGDSLSNPTDRFTIFASTGNVAINTTTDVASSKLTIESTTQGFLPPRMTTTQKNAIGTPATGLVVYDTTLNKLCVRTASAWETITSL